MRSVTKAGSDENCNAKAVSEAPHDAGGAGSDLRKWAASTYLLIQEDLRRLPFQGVQIAAFLQMAQRLDGKVRSFLFIARGRFLKKKILS